MPFKSIKQRKWMWANKPEMAKKWTEEHGSKVVTKKKNRVKRKTKSKPKR